MALTGKYDENIYFKLLDYDQSGYITQFGHVLPNANYIVTKRNLTRHLFDYVIRGSGYIMYGDKRYTVRAGDLVYMRKGVRVDYGADPNDPYEKLWFGADGPLVDSLASCYAGRGLIILHERDDLHFMKLKSLLTSGGWEEGQIMHLLLDLFLDLSGRAARTHSVGVEPDLAVKLKSYIDLRVAEKLSLDEAAESLHLSKRHVIRLFKDRYDITPGAYHQKLRMTAACHYLTETTLSVGEIASRLGFSDQSFFSSAFKKQLGVYPLAFRKSGGSV